MTVKRCMRCRGQKKVFKIGSGYSRIDTGGVEVDCPLCQGDGSVKIPELKKAGRPKKTALNDDKACSSNEQIS